jgi:hypothetical protein
MTEISGAEPAYTPARPLEQINAHHILQAMRARGQELLTRDEPVREEVYGEFARIQEAEKSAACSITMLALVHRAEARLELTPSPPAEEKEIEISPVHVAEPGSAGVPPASATKDAVETTALPGDAPEIKSESASPEPEPVKKVSSAKKTNRRASD